MIKAKNISKNYNNNVKAVKNVNLELEPSLFYGIKGNSGCGKTTLLQLLSTLTIPSEGEVFIDDIDIKNINEKELANLRSNKIGFIFQSFHLHQGLTALENVMLPMLINKSMDKKMMIEKAKLLLKKVNLEERTNHYPKQLSGGEQQRVAIARALANDPEYIFADEPTGNLDSENEVIIFNFLKYIVSLGKCVIVVSHNPILDNYADILYQMSDGVLATKEDMTA